MTRASLFICMLALLCLWPSGSRAAADYTIETIPNVRLSDRYNHVSNPDAIIRPDDVAQINRLLQTVEDSLGIEVAVVAVESIGENDARMFATDLFQHWGLGKKGEDNGLLIQLVTGQRAVVFETGYGLEGVLPDAICYRLQQQYMLPDFKAGDYSRGMLKGVGAVSRYLMASDYERASMIRRFFHVNRNLSFHRIHGFLCAMAQTAATHLSLLREKDTGLCEATRRPAGYLSKWRPRRRGLAMQKLWLHREEKPSYKQIASQ